jgi:hypothetical protein
MKLNLPSFDLANPKRRKGIYISCNWQVIAEIGNEEALIGIPQKGRGEDNLK